ncbi:MAG TPA: helix-turn-helix transcriptional regulator [Streptosporangiaceae bacterium]|nr:helix-turn-helix transcriptional regulator [Streptosporangiaceae bacterium]
MAADHRNVHDKLEVVFARQDVHEACERRDLGAIIRILNKYGITQGQIASLTGISQGRLSEYKTGKRVPTASSTFETFADGLRMPAPLRLALGLAPTADSPTSQHSGPDVLADTFDLQILAETLGRRGDSVKRRDMLSLAASLGTTTAVAQTDVWERLTYALTKPTALDEQTVRALENRSAGFHQLEELIPAPALFKGLTAHLRELSTLLNGLYADSKDELRNRLIIVAGESAVLAGWAASDMGETVTARNFYSTAERAAKEIDDPDILACALAYRSYIPSTKRAHGRARALLKDALEALSNSSSAGTLSWVAARHAEESAALGDARQALKSWVKAEEAFSVADPDEDRVWTRFLDQNRFDSYRIATYTKLPGKINEAETIAEAVLARLAKDADRKKAAIILEDIAVARLSQGAVGEACRLAKTGLAIVRETEFAMWLPRFEAIGQALKPWQRQPQIRAYLEDLATTKRQFTSTRR